MHMRAPSQNTQKTRTSRQAAQIPGPAHGQIVPGFPARWTRRVYEYLVFYLGYLYFGTGCALVSLLSAALHPLLPDATGTRLGRWMTDSHFRGFLTLLCASRLVRIDLAALDELRAERSIIIAPNHPCLLDAVLIISRLPQTACIMKADIWDSFFLGAARACLATIAMTRRSTWCVYRRRNCAQVIHCWCFRKARARARLR